jgi:hypothetical protein
VAAAKLLWKLHHKFVFDEHWNGQFVGAIDTANRYPPSSRENADTWRGEGVMMEFVANSQTM